MCPLAIYLKDLGYDVLGMDDNLKPQVRSILARKGVKIDSEKTLPRNCEKVIYSSAISPNHNICKQAKDLGIPLVRRGEFLAELLNNKHLIAVVGSHGKTTTTGLLIHSLEASDFAFDYLLGSLFADPQKLSAKSGSNEWVVAEIDESDGTIDLFNPEITLVVNFDWDHPDKYKTEFDLENAFSSLFARTKRAVIIPDDCQQLAAIKEKAICDLVTFGKKSDYTGEGSINSQGKTILKLSGTFPDQEMQIPNGGIFNANNGLAALTATHYLLGNISENPFENFSGIKRRQELLFENDRLMLMMDYAHHPTEIKALLQYVRSISEGNLIVVFQPHRYTRTKVYYEDFAHVLDAADQIILLPVFAANEPYLKEGTSDAIIKAFSGDPKKIVSVDFYQTQLINLLPNCVPDEKANILFVGAGDIEVLALDYQQYLKRHVWWQFLGKQLSPDTVSVENESLAKKTTLRLGGVARFFVEPASLEDLSLIVKEAHDFQCPMFVLGRGSNLVVPDEGFEGIVILLSNPFWKEIRKLENGCLWVGAGTRMKEICGFACKNGLSGFEFLEGIPGSLGGCLRMNAGAMGGWLFDVVESIKCVSEQGEVKVLLKEELTLGYRYCSDLKNAIAIGAVLKSPELKDQESIRAKIQNFSTKRKSSQPREPSAGCIFKNPEGNYAGELIESAGLKGEKVGQAEVSLIHGNFIINRGGATSRDVVGLVKLIKKRVFENSGINLEPEVLFLGKDWEEELA